MGGRPKLPLLKDAVPTLFLHNNFKADVKRRVYSEERSKRKEKEEVNFLQCLDDPCCSLLNWILTGMHCIMGRPEEKNCFLFIHPSQPALQPSP